MNETEKLVDNTVGAPFQDRIFLENFYPGAGRGEILAKMKSAVESGAPLMVISGGEGSGKTMMCKMLESECPPSIRVVYFESTVESFEDVVKMIAQKLGLQLSGADDGKTVDSVIEQIVAYLQRQSLGLLIIFDEAEDIYLATLERIRRMLDRVIASGVSMRILFSGRRTFLENCEQLAICDFRNTEDLHFDLLPLTEQETSDYLRTCSERLLSPDKRKVFNDEVARNIHAISKGKFRKINKLADESLRSHGDDTSFMALLGSVKDEESEAEADSTESSRLRPRRLPAAMWWICAAVCVVALLFFYMRPGEEQNAKPPVSIPVSTDKANVEVVQVEGNPPLPEVQPSVQEVTPPTSQQPEISQPQSEGSAPKVEKPSVPDLPLVVKEAVTSAQNQEKVVPTPAPVQSAPKKEVEGAQHLPAQHKVIPVVENKVPVLRQIPPLKVRLPSAHVSVSGAGKGAVRNEVNETASAMSHLSVDQLFQKRLHAGSTWAKSAKNDKFTIQLMVLTAKDAELNLKKMLAQPNYRKEADNFYIFKKNGSPEVVWVFYGEYPTMDMAHSAKSSLPQLFQDYHPYAISVKGATAKVRK